MRIVPAARCSPPLDRALEILPDLPTRRLILRERIAVAPAEAARGIDSILRRAQGGRTSFRQATIALGSLLIGMRRDEDRDALDALRLEAERADLRAVVALLAEAPAHRALARRGRLRELCIPERAPFRRWRLADEGLFRESHRYQVRHHLVGQKWAAHPSQVFIGRLLREPWLRLEDVLLIAARRPTTPALAFELAGQDRWLQRLSVREAMAQNPFTPTGIVLALLPSIRHPLLEHLRDAGDAHPIVSAAAAELVALRG